MIIKNVVIHDAIHREPYAGDIRIENGKLISIGGSAEDDGDILNADGLHAYPGFVDAHSHIGLDGYGGPTGMTYDYNEMNDICCPQLRGMDSYYALDAAIPMALEGGVTTVAAGPGSANVLGGTFLAVKLYGNTVDEAVIRPSVAMKCAFGENPKRCYKEKCDSARMTTAAILRQTLFEAKDYMLRKEYAGEDISKRPKFDMKMEALIPVLKREIPLKAHAHRSDDIMTAIRIAKEFDLKITIEHCTEGHLIVNELKKAGVPGNPGGYRNSGIDHHGRPGHTAAVPSALCRPGCQSRYGSVPGLTSDHDQSGQTYRRGRSRREPGDRQGCGHCSDGWRSARQRYYSNKGDRRWENTCRS